MHRNILLAFIGFLCATVVVSAQLEGSCSISPQDYYGLASEALATNPPACGMPYEQLNLALITAATEMDVGSTCNTCLKVVNEEDSTKFLYVLAVDLGGAGLDLSIPAFEYLFGQKTDASPASWSTVDGSFCEGIYTPGRKNRQQGVRAGSHTLMARSRKSSRIVRKKNNAQ